MTSKTMTRTLGALVGLSALALGAPTASAHAAPAHARSSAEVSTTSSTARTTAASGTTGSSTTGTTVRTASTTVNLNVRTGASINTQRLTTLPKGTRVTLTGVTTEHWTQISYQGKKRWVASRYLTPATTSVVQSGSPQRSTASTTRTAAKSTSGTTSSASKAKTSSTKSSSSTKTSAAAASGSTVWDQLAQCESSGTWSINTGNGFSGGLQFTASTWAAYGGTGSPSNASREQQIAVAQRVQASQGWGAWPACSAKLGLR